MVQGSEKMFGSIYKGKTVLVTGHTGFKGGWLVFWLKMLGARVIGLALLPPNGQPSLFHAADIEKDIVSVIHDIRDFSTVRTVFESHNPEIVFHMAAQPLVRYSYREPVETYETNVMGTVHVLEAVRRTPSVRAVVNVTSDKCYENKEWVWGYREEDPLGGHDPYSSSKGCAELVARAYDKSYFLGKDGAALASVRAGNVIGGGDWSEDRLVPDIVRAISTNVSVVIRHPNAVRPWQHVLEPLRGYLMLGELLYNKGDAFAGAWNFGPREDDVFSVSELAEKFVQLWGKGKLLIRKPSFQLHEAQYLKLDSGKARSRLNWRPLLTIDEALKMAVEWYRAYLQDATSVNELMREHIRSYMERI